MTAIVDTHQHLWDLSKFSLPWTEGDELMGRSYVTSDYLDATADASVAHAVYMEVDVSPEQKVAEVEHIVGICEDPNTPTIGAVVGGDPSLDGFAKYLTQIADSPYVKGVRQVLHVPDRGKGYCLSSEFISGVEALGAAGLSFDLCMRPSELADGAELARRVPNTRFIVDHCGNANPYIVSGASQADDPDDPFAHTQQGWMDGISALAAQPNVIIKISGIVARTQPGWTAADLAPTINYCLDAFGPERAIFGGDWPVCLYGAPYSQWAAAMREVISARAEEEQKKVLYDNAMAFYGLDG
ncbi:MAG: amidohydrolase family protein [Chloroflexota bacterium]